jgi:hypothetical protein
MVLLLSDPRRHPELQAVGGHFVPIGHDQIAKRDGPCSVRNFSAWQGLAQRITKVIRAASPPFDPSPLG